MRRLLKRMLRPAVLIPAILGAGLLVVLFTLADARKVLAIVEGFQRGYLLLFLLLMVIYFVLRAVQWHYLLRALGIRAPVRSQIFAYSLGELTKSLPIGNYFQNYLLRQSQGTQISVSSVATTLILLTEVVVSLLGVLVFGLGGWTEWLRPFILGGAVALGLLIALGYALRRVLRVPRWLAERPNIQRLLDELEHSRAGIRALARPRVLLVEMLLSVAYLGVAGVGLYCITRGVGLSGVTLDQALAVYCLSLAVGLLVPIPVDFGLIELSGAGALTAIAVGRSAALSVMLINRVLSIAATSALGIAVALVLLRHEARNLAPGEPHATARHTPLVARRRHAERQTSTAPLTRPLGARRPRSERSREAARAR